MPLFLTFLQSISSYYETETLKKAKSVITNFFVVYLIIKHYQHPGWYFELPVFALFGFLAEAPRTSILTFSKILCSPRAIISKSMGLAFAKNLSVCKRVFLRFFVSRCYKNS